MYIEIDHSNLKNSAKTIEDYVSLMTKELISTTNEVNSLTSNAWKYDDAKEFNRKWLSNSDPISVTSLMKTSLNNYSKKLYYAESEYKKAQRNAINRANSL